MDDVLRMVEVDCYKDTQSKSTDKIYINIDQINYITDGHLQSSGEHHVAYSIHMSNGDILQTYHDLPRILKSSLINSQKL